MLLYHLGQDHPDQVGYYLDQMRSSEDIGEVAAQAFEVAKEESADEHTRGPSTGAEERD